MTSYRRAILYQLAGGCAVFCAWSCAAGWTAYQRCLTSSTSSFAKVNDILSLEGHSKRGPQRYSNGKRLQEPGRRGGDGRVAGSSFELLETLVPRCHGDSPQTISGELQRNPCFLLLARSPSTALERNNRLSRKPCGCEVRSETAKLFEVLRQNQSVRDIEYKV